MIGQCRFNAGTDTEKTNTASAPHSSRLLVHSSGHGYLSTALSLRRHPHHISYPLHSLSLRSSPPNTAATPPFSVMMPKTWFSALVGGSGFGSWHPCHHSPRRPSSTASISSTKQDIILSSDDDEEQESSLLMKATTTEEEYQAHLALLIE